MMVAVEIFKTCSCQLYVLLTIILITEIGIIQIVKVVVIISIALTL